MHKLLALAGLGLASLLAPASAHAGVDVGIAIGVPLYGSPYYYAPGPVWHGPAVVYHDYYRPRYYDAPRIYYGRPYYRGYRDGYRDRDWHDRGRGRGHDHHRHDHHDDHGHRRRH